MLKRKETGRTCSARLRGCGSVTVWINGGDVDFIVRVGQKRLKNQAALADGHRPLQPETTSGLNFGIS